MSTFHLDIQNVRRLQRATVTLATGTTTVLIGSNNSGKTTMLDMVARTFWSLPFQYDESVRLFNTSWYRRSGTTFLRPKVSIRLPTNALSDALAVAPATLEFELLGRQTEARVSRNNTQDTKLVTVAGAVDDGSRKRAILSYEGPLPDAWSDAGMKCIPELRDEGRWRALGVDGDPPSDSVNAETLYRYNTPLSRALRDLADRVFYLPASRAPQWQATNTVGDLARGGSHHVSALLLRLRATNSAAFQAITSALNLLFPEVEELLLADSGGGLVPQLRFTDNHVEDAGNVGFGLQNVVHLLTVLLMVPARAILIIDEPETGLNRAAQRDLAPVFESLRPDVALLVATQSDTFCRGFSARSKMLLAEATGTFCEIGSVDVTQRTDLQRVARGLGLDPVFLLEGGKIVYVEGPSDAAVVGAWMRLHFPGHEQRYEVVPLGGCGRIGEEFVKPIIKAYHAGVFVLLDSDRPSAVEHRSSDIAKLAGWLSENAVPHYVLRKRELENYVGHDAIARMAGMHPATLQPLAGTDDWHDIKSAFQKERGFPYEGRRTVEAFQGLTAAQQKTLFGGETEAMLAELKRFLA
jgi:ABC-type branched-subunit amino acid transport system ATPase component